VNVPPIGTIAISISLISFISGIKSVSPEKYILLSSILIINPTHSPFLCTFLIELPSTVLYAYMVSIKMF
jgi:uncharacterized membrane protein YdjX (TVP38/TMEM64 family)